jgi:hypothetical protein
MRTQAGRVTLAEVRQQYIDLAHRYDELAAQAERQDRSGACLRR